MIKLGNLGILGVILFCEALFGPTYGWQQAQKWISALKPIPVIMALGVAAVVFWRTALIAPDGLLLLTLLDVGKR